MPRSLHSPTTTIRRRRTGATVAAVALVAVLGASCTTTSAPTRTTVPTAGPEAGVTSRYGSVAGPADLATTRAALAATHAFAAGVDAGTAAFVASVTQLGSDVAVGDTASLRRDELAAQADFDGFRALESADPVNASSLDELADSAAPTSSFGGLHAVERDLWSSGPLAADVSALSGQAPVAQYALSRERLGPEAIGTVAVDQLDWVVDVALPTSQEQFSHLGLVDVVATEQAASATFAEIEPLGRLVDPTLTAAVASQFAGLDAQVTALGPPTTTPDTTVSSAARRALSQQLDATATTLARLAAALAPYGTAGAPS